jgi:hypothetical protein
MTPESQRPVAWRDGEFLVLARSAPIAPPRCIFTNEEVLEDRKVRRQLSWGGNNPSKLWLPTKFQILWALGGMKFLTVEFGISNRIRMRQRWALGLGILAIVAGCGLFGYGLQRGFPPPMALLGTGAAMVVIALTFVTNTYTGIYIYAMDSEHVWLQGAKRPFLDSLPELPR